MYWPLPLLFTMLFIIVVSLQFAYLLKLYSNFMIVVKTAEVFDVNELKFNGYLKDFNKRYYNGEYLRRFENFKASLKEIARLNALEGNKVFGLTKFSDMSKQEFVSRILLKPDIEDCTARSKNCTYNVHHSKPVRRYKYDLPPTNFDWRAKPGVVGPILNQKLCSGCWAFSIVGVMESMAAIRGLGYDRRSIQELLDCSYNDGCRGGHVNSAMDFLCQKSNPKYVVTDEDYPLTLSVIKNCKIRNPKSGRRLKSFDYKCKIRESEIVSLIASKGPLIAVVDATNWMNYIGGIIQRACLYLYVHSEGVSNHVIQIIGYDGYETQSPRIPYYIIKNSFGQDFGEEGYVKIAMNNNVCGIADQVTSIEVI